MSGNLSVWEAGHMISEMFITLHVVLTMMYATLFYIVFFFIPYRHNRIKKTTKEIEAEKRAYFKKLRKDYDKREKLIIQEIIKKEKELQEKSRNASAFTNGTSSIEAEALLREDVEAYRKNENLLNSDENHLTIEEK